MKRLICRIFGHAKPHIRSPREYRAGVMIYHCQRCKCWVTQGVK